jgi:hypothetical protein
LEDDLLQSAEAASRFGQIVEPTLDAAAQRRVFDRVNGADGSLEQALLAGGC